MFRVRGGSANQVPTTGSLCRQPLLPSPLRCSQGPKILQDIRYQAHMDTEDKKAGACTYSTLRIRILTSLSRRLLVTTKICIKVTAVLTMQNLTRSP